MLRIALAWIHLLALGIGLGAIWARAMALSSFDESRVRRSVAADAWRGIGGYGAS